MTQHLDYIKVAEILLKQDKPISLDYLALISELPKEDLKKILDFFASEKFLTNDKNYERIIVNEKAKS